MHLTEARQGIRCLVVLGLCGGKHVAGLRGVHFCQKLSFADGLPFFYIYLLQCAATDKTYGSGGLFLHNAHIVCRQVCSIVADRFCHYADGGGLLWLLFVT